jgi:TonB family protein
MVAFPEILEAVALQFFALFVAFQIPRSYRSLSIGVAIVLAIWNGYVGIVTERQLPQHALCLVLFPMSSHLGGCPHSEGLNDFFPGLFGLGYPRQAKPELSQSDYAQGLAAYDRGDYQEAYTYLKYAVQDDGTNTKALVAFGNTELALRHYEGAKDAYKAALRLNDHLGAALSGIGRVLYAEGEQDDLAAQKLKDGLAISPNDPDAWTTYGLTLARLGDFKNAVAAFKSRYVQEIDWDQSTKRTFANALKELGNSEIGIDRQAAIGAYRSALHYWPEFAEAHFHLGYAHQLNGQLAPASSEYNSALTYRRGYAPAWNALGMLDLNAGHLDNAEGELKAACQIDGNLADAHKNLGNFYSIKGNWYAAIAEYGKAIGIDPYFAEAFLHRAYAEQNLVNLTPMELSDLNSAIAYGYRPAQAYELRGRLFQKLLSPGKAASDLSAAIALNRRDPLNYKLLGDAQLLLGGYKGAIANYDIATGLFGKACAQIFACADAYKSWGNALRKQNDETDAILRYNTAMAYRPAFFEVYRNRGIAYEATSQCDSARTDLEHAHALQLSDSITNGALSELAICGLIGPPEQSAPATSAPAQSVQPATPSHNDDRGPFPIDELKCPELENLLLPSGVVDIGVDISASGKVTDVFLIESSGNDRLDALAQECAWHWSFIAATQGGIPAPSTYDHRIRFVPRY